MIWTPNDLAHLTDDGLKYLSQRHRDIYRRLVNRCTRVVRYLGQSTDQQAVVQALDSELQMPFQFLENLTPRVNREPQPDPVYPYEYGPDMGPDEETVYANPQQPMQMQMPPAMLAQMGFPPRVDPTQQAAFALNVVSLFGTLRYHRPQPETSIPGSDKPEAVMLSADEDRLYKVAMQRLASFLGTGQSQPTR